MGIFNINWRTQASNIAPPHQRGDNFLDFFEALLKPLKTNSDATDTEEAILKKRAKWNSQKIILQAALNDILGVTMAPWVIVEIKTEIGSPTYFFNESEGQSNPKFYNESEPNATTFFFNESEISTEADFKILIPVGIHTTELENQVRGEVNLFKLAGKNYTIETY